ncbi:hypothetical protein SAMD00019534_118290 [Acytostelium subglobosum LB1]|uniref:hypothetical protein n=1 Tax=Acytostelium subglobosum LB1 TaxID=1410327 RepID=UPI000644F660|nr:hypothetical protein SAMD00019534_118290 [Acytostelium subglobosum LB1]GAM28653.1 hypothetical protein SAMD00019534_118290 [Acytostelium subglobosum LB1]|eukprot:XP_012748431.1 hypothetical protein SAMD00019534_118290 [Acytostelium subglobosum LB1]
MDRFLIVKPSNKTTVSSAAVVDTNDSKAPPVAATTTITSSTVGSDKENQPDNKIQSHSSKTTTTTQQQDKKTTTTPQQPTTPKKKKAPAATPKKSNAFANKSTTSTTATTTTPAAAANTLSSTTSQTQTQQPQMQQTCLSFFFKPLSSNDEPVWKYLFEKEAADRAERERLEKERQERAMEELRVKKAEERKKRLEIKKIKDAERRRREEEEWQEYQMIQEKRNKGVEIIPHLYLGSFVAAKNVEWLTNQEAPISKIINVTTEIKCYFTKGKDTTVVVQEDDDEEEDEDAEDEEDEDEDAEDEDEDVDVDAVDEAAKDVVVSDEPQTTVSMDGQPKDQSKDDVVMIDATTVAPQKDSEQDAMVDQPLTDQAKDVEEQPQQQQQQQQVEEEEPMKEEEEKEVELVIDYLRVPVADSSRAQIEQYFDQSCVFIETGIKSGANILVHCQQGRSRSPTIIIAYLMKCCNWTLERAWTVVQEKSPKTLTVNDGFKQKLMALEHSIFKTNSNVECFLNGRTTTAAGHNDSATGGESQRSLRAKALTDIKNRRANGSNAPPVKPVDTYDDCCVEDEDDADADGDKLISTLDDLKVVKRRKE